MIIEITTSAVAETLAAVHALAFDTPWNAADLASLSQGVNAILLQARDGDDVAGFILCRCIADEAEVLTLAVSPAYRRQGIGSRLLENATALAGARGAGRMFLEVAADNPAAIALYEGAGFRPVGNRSGYYSRVGGAIDAVVMRRDLNS